MSNGQHKLFIYDMFFNGSYSCVHLCMSIIMDQKVLAVVFCTYPCYFNMGSTHAVSSFQNSHLGFLNLPKLIIEPSTHT